MKVIIKMLALMLSNHVVMMEALATLHTNQGGVGSGYHADCLKRRAKRSMQALEGEEFK